MSLYCGAKPLACNMQELTATVGSRGPQTARDLESLSALRLIEKKSANTSALLTSDEIYLTPTPLGLQLFALCNGHQGPIRDFYFLSPAETLARTQVQAIL